MSWPKATGIGALLCVIGLSLVFTDTVEGPAGFCLLWGSILSFVVPLSVWAGRAGSKGK